MMRKEDILLCLEKYCYFDNDLNENSFYECIVSPLKAANCFADDWTWDSGVTKGVLIFKKADFVIKIPFRGEEEGECSHFEDDEGCWTDDEENGHYVPEDYCLSEFSGAYLAKKDIYQWDYCAVESERYEIAEAAGLEGCFAKTELIGYCQDYPVYAQQKASMFSHMYSAFDSKKETKRTKEDYARASSLISETHFSVDENWVLDFIWFYSEDFFKKFTKFCLDNFIDDLHNGNIGYIDGIPVLVDYSSYEC